MENLLTDPFEFLNTVQSRLGRSLQIELEQTKLDTQ